MRIHIQALSPLRWLILGVGISASCAFGASEAAEAPQADPARLGIYYTGFFQPEGSNSNSVLLLWSPSYRLNDQFSLMGDFGGSYLNTPSQKFVLFNATAGPGYLLSSSVRVNLMAGVQNWTREAGTLPVVGTSVSYLVHHPSLL